MPLGAPRIAQVALGAREASDPSRGGVRRLPPRLPRRSRPCRPLALPMALGDERLGGRQNLLDGGEQRPFPPDQGRLALQSILDVVQSIPKGPPITTGRLPYRATKWGQGTRTP
jgi:hypothetical protein